MRPTPPAWRVVAALAILLAAIGAAAGVASLGASRLGLGLDEDFLLYRLAGLPRRVVAIGGAAALLFGLVMLAVVRARRWLWRNRRVLAANATLTAASIALTLAVLEMGVRMSNGVPVLSLRNWIAERNALLTIHTLNDYDPLLGWVLRADQRLSPQDPATSFTTGARGVRLSSPDAPMPGTGGILAVGDSFTVGSEVGDRHAWPAQLERLLGTPVVNAAVGGWGADQIVLRAETLLDEFKPRAVVVSFYTDDIARAGLRVFSGGNKPFFAVDGGTLSLRNTPVPVFTGRWNETPWTAGVLGHSYLFVWATDRMGLTDRVNRASLSYVRAANDPVAVSCLLLQRLQRSLGERSTRMLFVMQYGGEMNVDRHQRGKDAQQVLDCAARAGIETVDLWDDLVAVYRRSFQDYVALWVSFDGRGLFGHMSSAGNRLVAERIAQRLGR